MQGYWLRFSDGSQGYCEGETPYHAIRIAEKLTKKKVEFEGDPWMPRLQTIPHAAHPVIWQFECPVSGKEPTFCSTPEKCAGHYQCPRVPVCTD